MNARELRIGNIAEYAGVVTHIDYNSIRLQCFADAKVVSHMDSKEYIGYDPILITEEWLANLGFSCHDSINKGYAIKINFNHEKMYLYCSVMGVVALWDDVRKIDIILKKECKHIHQLQNLYYALTGEELIEHQNK